jgi:hypothetical protein
MTRFDRAGLAAKAGASSAACSGKNNAMPIRRLQQEGRLSGALVHGNTVYLAGQTADILTWRMSRR